jgi:hypothetical protein
MADTVTLALFVVATFLGSFVAGLAGFAFGLVAAAIWLQFDRTTLLLFLAGPPALLAGGWPGAASLWSARRSRLPQGHSRLAAGGRCDLGCPFDAFDIVIALPTRTTRG